MTTVTITVTVEQAKAIEALLAEGLERQESTQRLIIADNAASAEAAPEDAEGMALGRSLLARSMAKIADVQAAIDATTAAIDAAATL